MLVGHAPRPECRAPSLPPRYQASSLLRARPSLHHASVLGSSWVPHLEVSLGIAAQVPAFRTRACTGLTPSLCRPPLGPKQDVPRARPRPLIKAWFRWHPLAFDTFPAVHFRSSSQRSPDGFIPPFPETLTTPAIVPEQLPVVWALTLPSEPEGPSLISCAASTLVQSLDLTFRAVAAHDQLRGPRQPAGEARASSAPEK